MDHKGVHGRLQRQGDELNAMVLLAQDLEDPLRLQLGMGRRNQQEEHPLFVGDVARRALSRLGVASLCDPDLADQTDVQHLASPVLRDLGSER